MKTLQILVLIIIGAASSSSNKLRFDNYTVYSVNVRTEEQLRVLQNLEATPNEFIFLDAPLAKNSAIQIAVSPAKQRKFDLLSVELKFDPVLISSDLQSAIDNEQPKRARRTSFGWEDYHTLDEIYAWLDELVIQHDDVLSVETIGRSYEQRELKVIKLSYKEGNPGIFIDANIHAREWITSATVTWILSELLTSEEPAVRDLAELRLVHCTSGKSRWFRLYAYCDGGTSDNPCSDVYAGKHPESEIEVKTISNYVRSIADKLNLYLAVHSRGQYVLVPFGYSAAPYPPNYKDLMQIGKRAAVDMYKVHKTPYRVGTTADVLYVASGISVDWAYGAANIPLAYTFELRDQVEYGFILPADQIIPNAEEVLAAFVGMIDEARVLGYF